MTQAEAEALNAQMEAREARIKALNAERLAENVKSFRIADTAAEDEAIEALYDLIAPCSCHSLDAWRTVLSVYDRIPNRFKLCLLLNFYVGYLVDYPDFWERLDEAFMLEPIEARQVRIERLRNELEGHVDADDTIEIFRGERKGSMTHDFAVSWTINRSVAERFAKMFYNKGRRRVVSARISISDILRYTDDRQEREVIVRPMANLKSIASQRVTISGEETAEAHQKPCRAVSVTEA